jgi:hypothetical protein
VPADLPQGIVQFLVQVRDYALNHATPILEGEER